MSRRISRRAFLNAGAAAPAVLAGVSQLAASPAPAPQSAKSTCHSNGTFRNWAKTISCKPETYCQPKSEADVIEIVKTAGGKHVRTVGAGHSWSPLVLTKDVLVNLDEMKTVLNVDKVNRTATVQAGIRLKHLTEALAKENLGLKNLGSILEQSIAGATATSTHGTGLGLGSLSTQIVKITLVDGTGRVRTLTAADLDYFYAARVSLGALGIVTEVTIQCVPNYDLEFTAYWYRFDDVLKKLDALIHDNERVRLWWLVPFSFARDYVIVTTMNSLRKPAIELREPSDARNGLPMDLKELLKKRPRLSSLSADGFRFWHFIDNYVPVLTLPLLPVFHRECEYAVPVENAVDALKAFRRIIEEDDLALDLPVEVRFVAKDQNLLSPAYDRDVCYIEASTQCNPAEVYECFEPVMKQYGGRPHWGKWFTLTQAEAKDMFPGYKKFRDIRKQQFDPDGVFTKRAAAAALRLKGAPG